MIRTTLVARTMDGKVLCESKQGSTAKESHAKAYAQSQQLLKTMAKQPVKQTVKVGDDYFFQ